MSDYESDERQARRDTHWDDPFRRRVRGTLLGRYLDHGDTLALWALISIPFAFLFGLAFVLGGHLDSGFRPYFLLASAASVICHLAFSGKSTMAIMALVPFAILCGAVFLV
ncbi:hypothetical protein A3709_20605 [Halioglobus sp. HI00S01]|uniref:hypothetical protein n=1 Tax=Halioglobus sp. HI00S01 TaxID=1822214 RepID=UPI0007C3F5E3|nr:hypothetical protein [Halioglobus sp. HI00S01]KZX58015.1 hypothetical protein A3709_20605 [Halioglobus sp. HI00S01]